MSPRRDRKSETITREKWPQKRRSSSAQTFNQPGLKVFGLNAEGFLKILGTQKLLHEISVGCSLLLNVCLEGAYLLLIGAWGPARQAINSS